MGTSSTGIDCQTIAITKRMPRVAVIQRMKRAGFVFLFAALAVAVKVITPEWNTNRRPAAEDD
jgi:hypothetical protein